MVSNEMLYHDEVHSLLVKCFKTFIRSIGQMRGGYGDISVSTTHGSHCAISPDIDSQIAHKIQDFGTLSVLTANDVLYHTVRQQLPMNCFKPFLGYTSMMEEAAGSICKPHVGVPMPISTNVNSPNCTQNALVPS